MNNLCDKSYDSGDKQVVLSTKKFLGMARYAYERSNGTVTSDGGWTACSSEAALASILFSWISLECFINEVPDYIDSVKGCYSAHEKLLEFAKKLQKAESDRSSTAAKYEEGYKALSGNGYDKGALPYQHFHILESIRHGLVHYKADVLDYSVESRDEVPNEKLMRTLTGNGLLDNEESKGPMSLANRLGRPTIAAFAHDTAVEMIKSLIDKMPECQMSEVFQTLWKDWTKINKK